ncbi:MAG: FecR family protein [Candidatus Xenobia bacterium]
MVLGQLAPALFAQQGAAVASMRLSATRGKVEMLAPNGKWEPLTGTTEAQVGTAVRTAKGAELTATFQDGSTLTLAEDSAMKFTELSLAGQGHVTVKAVGQVAATLSPAELQQNVVAIDMPIGRAVLNQQFAVGHAVRAEAANSVAHATLQTPNARAVEMAIVEGAGSMQAFYNITGTIASIDPASQSFMLNTQQGSTRVVVGAHTVLAAKDEKTAVSVHTPEAILSHLAVNQQIIAYGLPAGAEGPGPASGTLQASILYPQDATAMDGLAYLDTPTPPTAGQVVTATKGHTLRLTAGALLPVLISGLALSSMGAAHVAVSGAAAASGAVATAAVASGTLIAAGVVAAAAAVAVSNKGAAPPPPPALPVSSGGTGSVAVNLQHPRGHAALTFGAAPQNALAATIAGSPLLSATSLGTLSMGAAWKSRPTLGVQLLAPEDPWASQSALLGTWPLGPRVRLHMAASVGATSELVQAEADLGIDYQVSTSHVLGLGWQHQAYNLTDAFGNVTSVSVDGPQLRYSVRY